MGTWANRIGIDHAGVEVSCSNIWSMNICVQDKQYSMTELQSMFWEMAQSFEFPEFSGSAQQQQQQQNWFSCSQQPVYGSSQWFYSPFPIDDSRTSKRARCDTKPVSQNCSNIRVSGLEMYGTSQLYS